MLLALQNKIQEKKMSYIFEKNCQVEHDFIHYHYQVQQTFEIKI